MSSAPVIYLEDYLARRGRVEQGCATGAGGAARSVGRGVDQAARRAHRADATGPTGATRPVGAMGPADVTGIARATDPTRAARLPYVVGRPEATGRPDAAGLSDVTGRPTTSSALGSLSRREPWAARRRRPRPAVVRGCRGLATANPVVCRGQDRRRSGRGGLRLTRRGRLVVTVATVALTVALGIGLAELVDVRVAAGAAGVGSDDTTTVMVQPGQTLWDIAVQLAPEEDPRVVLDVIARLNGLRSAGDLEAGQRLVVPVAMR